MEKTSLKSYVLFGLDICRNLLLVHVEVIDELSGFKIARKRSRP